ncbi:MAG TPA: hypothetical protein PK829_00910 [Promineifilum sp.]|nr:hypothetical protein [Promineifilum sp.]HQF71474.1 hypothetical protein [Promineifilum sp.]
MSTMGSGGKAARLATPLLLLLAIGGWYWLSQSAVARPTAVTVVTPMRASATAASPMAASTAPPQGLIGQATPWGAAGLEPTATATVAVVAPGAIALYGPPAGSRFGVGDDVSFYWSWPDELADGQRFVLYLVSAGERRPLGQVDETNLGRAYHLRVPVEETGEFRWEVVLEDAATGATIGASENRAISMIGS